MKVGDRVQMREGLENEGIVRKLAGHRVTVRWSQGTTTQVSKYMLKAYEPKGNGESWLNRTK